MAKRRRTGGVDIDADEVTVGGDVVGRDKNIWNVKNTFTVLGMGSAVILVLGLIAYALLPRLLPPSAPTPTPFAFTPTQSDETLLIIVDFDNRSGGQIGVDPAQRIYNLITEKLPGSNVKLRVEQYHQPIKDTNEARRVLKVYGATVLIWGWFDQIGAEPKVEIDKDRIRLSNPDLPEYSLATPESFVIRFTEEIPAQAGYTTFFALGMIQYRSGVTELAEEFFTKAIASAKESSTGAVNPWEALLWRGTVYYDSGELDLAIADYTESLALHPHREGYLNRCASYGSQGKYTAAIADCTQAISIDPSFKEAYNNRGLAYADQGNYVAAITDYTKAIEIDPTLKEAYSNRGIAYEAQGDHAAAIADYTKAIEIDPTFKEAYSNRGIAYEAQGDHAAAIADYTKAIELDPVYSIPSPKIG